MIELEPHEIEMVYGGDHWGYEGTEDSASRAAQSYSYGSGGFWGPSYPSCTNTVEVQSRSVSTVSTGGLSCGTTGSFPFVTCTLTPANVTTHTTSVTRTTTCTY